MAFKMKYQGKPSTLFKHSPLNYTQTHSSPIKTEEEEEKPAQPITNDDITKIRYNRKGTTRWKWIVDPNTNERIKVKEEYDDVLGWHQVGVPQGKEGQLYELDKIEENTQKENIIKDIGSEDNLFSTLDLIKSSKNPNWWSGNLEDWRDPKWTPAQAFKEKTLNRLLKLYPRDHPVVREAMQNLKGPPPGFKY